MQHQPVKPVPAATLMLVRDGAEGLEVFMVERHRQIEFAGGATVFPGGKLDPQDESDALHRCCAERERFEPRELALRVAAIREGFEESGILLARPRGERGWLAPERARAIVAAHREAVRSGRRRFLDVVCAEDLELACDRLVLFAHWITPEPLPKRYDTFFYLAEAPREQTALHDGAESVDSLWAAPARILAEADAGRRTLVFATRMNLRKLAQSQTVAEALRAARAASVVTVLPRVEEGAGGERLLRIPADAGYGASEIPLAEAIGAMGRSRG